MNVIRIAPSSSSPTGFRLFLPRPNERRSLRRKFPETRRDPARCSSHRTLKLARRRAGERLEKYCGLRSWDRDCGHVGAGIAREISLFSAPPSDGPPLLPRLSGSDRAFSSARLSPDYTALFRARGTFFRFKPCASRSIGIFQRHTRRASGRYSS